MSQQELIEKYRKEIKQHIVDTYGCDETPQYEEEFDDLESILTRLLAEYAAQRDVGRQKLIDALVTAAMKWHNLEPECGCGNEDCQFDDLHNAAALLAAQGEK